MKYEAVWRVMVNIDGVVRRWRRHVLTKATYETHTLPFINNLPFLKNASLFNHRHKWNFLILSFDFFFRQWQSTYCKCIINYPRLHCSPLTTGISMTRKHIGISKKIILSPSFLFLISVTKWTEHFICWLSHTSEQELKLRLLGFISCNWSFQQVLVPPYRTSIRYKMAFHIKLSVVLHMY